MRGVALHYLCPAAPPNGGLMTAKLRKIKQTWEGAEPGEAASRKVEACVCVCVCEPKTFSLLVFLLIPWLEVQIRVERNTAGRSGQEAPEGRQTAGPSLTGGEVGGGGV